MSGQVTRYLIPVTEVAFQKKNRLNEKQNAPRQIFSQTNVKLTQTD